MLIGYARVSTRDQRLQLQLDALRQAGCQRIYRDKRTGRTFNRPGLHKAMNNMQSGDTLVVWKLSRLGRSLKELINVGQLLADRGIQLRSLCESLDTSTAMGTFFFHVLAALAQLDADITRENTIAGLAAARARGHIGGKRRIMDEVMIDKARRLLAEQPWLPKSQVCCLLHVSKATLYRYL